MEATFKPLLRQIDVIPGEYQGIPVIFLRDPVGFIDEVIALPREIVFILAFMDGDHDLRDLQVEITRRTGQIVPLEEIQRLVEFLDEKGFLWSQRFEEFKERVYQKWFQQPYRLMAHANSAYPLEEERAKEFLEEILALVSLDKAQSPKILIAPHIDLRVGAKAYALAYKRFKLPPGARVIILGVGHYLDFPYSVLTKDILTPFGNLRIDKGGLLYLANSKRIELFPDHIAHKLEHSVEFQSLFLHYLNGDNIAVLPFLIGPYKIIKLNEDLVNNFLMALAELVDEKTYLVLGIDFCHLGYRYGDTFGVNEELKRKALGTDKALLESAFEGKKEEVEKIILSEEKMKICGSSCLFLLAKLIQFLGVKGQGEIFYQDFLPFGEGSGVSVVSAGYFF